jgi:hypothetical protein
MRALVIALALSPAIAFAQPAAIAPAPMAPVPAPPPAVAPPAAVVPPPIVPAPVAPVGAEPSECVTTTTVRCTGAAAPYAVQAAQPQTIVVPAPAPPPVAAPSTPPQVPAIILDPRALGDGWRLVQTPDGNLWRERRLTGDAPAVWGTGLAFWLGSYTVGAIGGTVNASGLFAWLPIMGPFINASFTRDAAQVLWAVDGVVQAGGFVTFLVGLAAGPDKIERLPLRVMPTGFVGGGQGIALGSRF